MATGYRGLESSSLILIRWETKDIKAQVTDSSLKHFLEAHVSDGVPEIKKGDIERTVILKFKKEKNVSFLKTKFSDDLFWHITIFEGLKGRGDVKVSNLPAEYRQESHIYHFFKNKNACGLDIKSNIKPVKVSPCRDWCVLKIDEQEEAESLLKKQTHLKPFNKCKLEIAEFYEELYSLDAEEKRAVTGSQAITIEGIQQEKMDYLKQCYKDKLKTHMECVQIDWPKDKACKLTFHCGKSKYPGDKRAVEDRAKGKFNDLLKSIEVVKKDITPAVWETVLKQHQKRDTVLVKQEKPKLVVVGLKDSDDIKKTLSEIDNVKLPPAKVTKSMKVKDELNLEGFGILREVEKKYDIKIDVNKGTISLTGHRDNVKAAEIWVLQQISDLNVQKYEFPHPAYGKILSTPMMQDTITADIEISHDQAQWSITPEQLVVITRENQEPEHIHNFILDLIVEEEMSREGGVVSKDELTKKLKSAAEIYEPYVILSHKISGNVVTVKIICGTNYLDPMQTEILKVFDETLVQTESIVLPEHVFNYIYNNSMARIHKQIEEKKLKVKECFNVNKDQNKIDILGYKDTRQVLRKIVLSAAGDVRTSWRPMEKEGVGQFFTENSSLNFLKGIRKSYHCAIETVTKREMKERQISCIVLLESGQALFAGTGSLSRPINTVDAIVNPTSILLRHCTSLSKQLIMDAGTDVSKELEDYVKTEGPLKLGGVYTSSSGQLPCQRILHASVADDPNSRDYDAAAVKLAIENIFKAMNKDILRSVAMAIPWHGMIMVVLRSVEECISQHSHVREVYFYDVAPQGVRQIKNCMDQRFTRRCFHLPVENIALGKGQMTIKQPEHTLERKGSRTLPLPGEKRIVIEWGSIAETSADVLVNTTPTAPKPSGKIFHSLQTKSKIDLGKSCADAFTGVTSDVKDGLMVTTDAGSLGCQKVYHIKICHKWPDMKEQELSDYIVTCLKEALRESMGSIAFPTIGTADCKYPREEVAKTLITTIGNFMKIHMTGKLNEVKIVVFKRDRDMTIAFEETIQKMYSKRPHRLEAVIEESTISKEKLEEEEKAKYDKAAHPPPVPSNPVQAHANPNPNVAPGRLQIAMPGNSTLIVIKGCLEKAVADVIVCTTSGFPKIHGVIPNALITAGGRAIQKSIEQKYPNGYPGQGVAEGDGGRLNCKRVYYIKLTDYRNNNDLQTIYNTVMACLDQAENACCQSIVFPTIGTGGFKFPEKDSANKTFQAIQSFFAKGTRSLKKVVIVVYETLLQQVQVFQTAARQCFNVPQAQVVYQRPKSSFRGPSLDKSSSLWTVPGTSTTVELKYGLLEQWKADVILDTTTSFPDLNGAIPQSLLRAAGPELLNECQNYALNITEGDIAVTSGYKLSCKMVFHYVLPQWIRVNGETMIQICVSDCLDKMKQLGHSSIALPAIGTGGFKYEADLVATGIYRAVEAYGKANPNAPMRVTVVLFMQAANVNQIFHDELKKWLNKGQGSSGHVPPAAPQKVVRFPVDEEVSRDVEPTGQKGDFLLFRFTSDDPKKIDSAFQDIKKELDRQSKTENIDLDKSEVDVLKASKAKEVLEDHGKTCKVSVVVDLDNKKIIIQGIGDRVDKCHRVVLEKLQEIKKLKNQQLIGQHIYKYLEWCYAEDNGSMWVPYPKHIAFDLEEAHEKGLPEIKFKDSDDKEYVVDLNNFKEYEASCKNNTTTIGVDRKDLKAEDVKLPNFWHIMGESEILKRVTLNQSDSEYGDVEKSFQQTLGRKAFIKQIQRIQNRILYMLYETKKKELKSKCQGQIIERDLWHGGKEDCELPVLTYGFNRSYSGKTFGGNVWYGFGCYFAVKSEYADGQDYSPAYADGYKRMYLVDVLIGNTTSVKRGYQGRSAPLLPNSQTDRYDSVCDDAKNPTEFVIFNDTQAYPKYIISFK